MYPFCIYVFHPAEGIYQFSSVAQLYPPLCDPMDCSTPGFPVHHQLPEPAQTHVLQVGDAIQPSHPLSSPSPPAFSLSHSIVFLYFFELITKEGFLISPCCSFKLCIKMGVQFSSVQSLICVRLFVTPWTATIQASLSITDSQGLLRLMFHRVSDAIQPSYPLSSLSPPTLNLSQHQGLFK